MSQPPQLPPMERLLSQAREVGRQMAEAEAHRGAAGQGLLEAEVVSSVQNRELSALARPVSQREMDRLVQTVRDQQLSSGDLKAVHSKLTAAAGLTPPQQSAAKSTVARLHNLLKKTERLTREQEARCTLLVGEERTATHSADLPDNGEVEMAATCKGPKGNAQEQAEWLRKTERILSQPEDELPE